MPPRDVYLGPFDLGVLSGREEALRQLDGLNSASTDLFRLLCVTLMQAGADRFSIPGANPSAFTTSQFLRARITNKSNEAADQSWIKIREVFEGCLRAEKRRDTPELASARRLQYLICDIARAAESGSSLAIVARLPEIDSAAKVLPPDLISPSKTLLHALSSVTATVPVPKAHIDRRDVALISELLQSDVYETYRSSHEDLQRRDVGLARVVGLIGARAAAVRRAAPKYINTGQRILSLLPATARLLDEVAGKAPGILADLLGKVLQGWLASRSRLVVYRFDLIFDGLMAGYPWTAGTTQVRRKSLGTSRSSPYTRRRKT